MITTLKVVIKNSKAKSLSRNSGPVFFWKIYRTYCKQFAEGMFFHRKKFQIQNFRSRLQILKHIVLFQCETLNQCGNATCCLQHYFTYYCQNKVVKNFFFMLLKCVFASISYPISVIPIAHLQAPIQAFFYKLIKTVSQHIHVVMITWFVWNYSMHCVTMHD